MAHKCKYKGHSERCLSHDSYPITKHGKLDCGRVRNAVARAAQNGDTSKIIKGGARSAIKKCGIKSKLNK
jgi:hypothetical protein